MLSNSDTFERQLADELPVNEIFQTIQGEATYTGTPSTFVRLQGCEVGCPWCDTKHTWALNAFDEVPPAYMLAKDGDSEAFSGLSVQAIVVECKRGPNHVVITGGEPCAHDLGPLTSALLHAGRSVQIETSGTELVRAAALTFVTVSPKIDMPGGKQVLEQPIARANELKMPVGKQADIERLLSLIEQYNLADKIDAGALSVWLQPLSQSKKATELCVKMATAFNWRVSIQTHKLLAVR